VEGGTKKLGYCINYDVLERIGRREGLRGVGMQNGMKARICQTLVIKYPL
jgi:hypothetical protein